MTKAEIITRIYEKVGFSKKDATDVVEATFDIIKGCLEKGEKVKISGFGNFVVNTKRPPQRKKPANRRRDHHRRSQGSHV